MLGFSALASGEGGWRDRWHAGRRNGPRARSRRRRAERVCHRRAAKWARRALGLPFGEACWVKGVAAREPRCSAAGARSELLQADATDRLVDGGHVTKQAVREQSSSVKFTAVSNHMSVCVHVHLCMMWAPRKNVPYLQKTCLSSATNKENTSSVQGVLSFLF